MYTWFAVASEICIKYSCRDYKIEQENIARRWAMMPLMLMMMMMMGSPIYNNTINVRVYSIRIAFNKIMSMVEYECQSISTHLIQSSPSVKLCIYPHINQQIIDIPPAWRKKYVYIRVYILIHYTYNLSAGCLAYSLVYLLCYLFSARTHSHTLSCAFHSSVPVLRLSLPFTRLAWSRL